MCGNLGRKAMLGVLFLFARLRCIAVDAKLSCSHPGDDIDDDDDDDDDPDDNHYYASPPPAVLKTIMTTHPLHF